MPGSFCWAACKLKKFKKDVDKSEECAIISPLLAGVAHPVERHLAKVEVASSSLVTRSIKPLLFLTREVFSRLLFFFSFGNIIQFAPSKNQSNSQERKYEK